MTAIPASNPIDTRPAGPIQLLSKANLRKYDTPISTARCQSGLTSANRCGLEADLRRFRNQLRSRRSAERRPPAMALPATRSRLAGVEAAGPGWRASLLRTGSAANSSASFCAPAANPGDQVRTSARNDCRSLSCGFIVASNGTRTPYYRRSIWRLHPRFRQTGKTPVPHPCASLAQGWVGELTAPWALACNPAPSD